MSGSKYSVRAFMRDANAILATGAALEDKKADIAERMAALSKRDDLTRFALPFGPADGSTQNYLLAFEPPYTLLGISQFDPHYYSPIHEHGDFWVIGCGWRGVDRWDMYERLDDGSVPGYADIRMVDQIFLPPGRTVWMPPPPRAIHSHNNDTGGFNYELIFTAAKPMEPEDRFYYDPDEKACWPSLFAPAKIFPDTPWPPELPGHSAMIAGGRVTPPVPWRDHAADMLARAADGLRGLKRHACPVCDLVSAPARLGLAR